MSSFLYLLHSLPYENVQVKNMQKMSQVWLVTASAIYFVVTWLGMSVLHLQPNALSLLHLAPGVAFIIYVLAGARALPHMLISGVFGYWLSLKVTTVSIGELEAILVGLASTFIPYISARMWDKYFPNKVSQVSQLLSFTVIVCLIPGLLNAAFISLPSLLGQYLSRSDLLFFLQEITVTYAISLLLCGGMYVCLQLEGTRFKTFGRQNIFLTLLTLTLTSFSFLVLPGVLFLTPAVLLFMSYRGQGRALVLNLFAMMALFTLFPKYSLGAFTLPDSDDGMISMLIFALTTILINLSIVVHVQQLRQANKARDCWKDKASRDALTGLFNRYGLLPELAMEYEKAQFNHSTFSLAVVDVDFFKRINDTFGHSAGDEIIKRLGELLRESVSSNDLVARYGGEEFVILFRRKSLDEAMDLMQKVRAQCEQLETWLNDTCIRFTISIGIAQYREEDTDAEMIFDRADSRLYKAKQEGRNLIIAHGT